MDPLTIAAIAMLMFAGAALYTSVGHAGASAYLAIMALFSVAPEVMRPTALALNILVASFVLWRFARAGQFDGRLLAWLVAGAIPAAFLGGSVQLDGAIYRPLVGFVLVLAALRLLWPRPVASETRPSRAPGPAALASGAGIGLLAGLTGTGGGIFLSPVLLFLGWAEPRKVSGIAAGFILANSVAGLAGNLASVGQLPAELPWFVAAVAGGALLGTHFGVRRLPVPALLRLLGAVLLIAGGKLILS